MSRKRNVRDDGGEDSTLQEGEQGDAQSDLDVLLGSLGSSSNKRPRTDFAAAVDGDGDYEEEEQEDADASDGTDSAAAPSSASGRPHRRVVPPRAFDDIVAEVKSTPAPHTRRLQRMSMSDVERKRLICHAYILHRICASTVRKYEGDVSRWPGEVELQSRFQELFEVAVPSVESESGDADNSVKASYLHVLGVKHRYDSSTYALSIRSSLLNYFSLHCDAVGHTGMRHEGSGLYFTTEQLRDQWKAVERKWRDKREVVRTVTGGPALPLPLGVQPQRFAAALEEIFTGENLLAGGRRGPRPLSMVAGPLPPMSLPATPHSLAPPPPLPVPRAQAQLEGSNVVGSTGMDLRTEAAVTQLVTACLRAVREGAPPASVVTASREGEVAIYAAVYDLPLEAVQHMAANTSISSFVRGVAQWRVSRAEARGRAAAATGTAAMTGADRMLPRAHAAGAPHPLPLTLAAATTQPVHMEAHTDTASANAQVDATSSARV